MQQRIPIHLPSRQRGVSLFIVILFVMLSMLLALWSSRTALFNEMVVGNDADYQRAFEAAQALIQDAELDIRGAQPNGIACVNDPGKPDVCRAATAVNFPLEDKALPDLLNTLDDQPTKCLKGICLKRVGIQDFWMDKPTLNTLITADVGARYGQFSGAQTGAHSNPILNTVSAGQGGWYWVEIMPYDSNAGNSGLITTGGSRNLALHLLPSVAYRITAIARGIKPSTQVVLQSTFVRQKMKN